MQQNNKIGDYEKMTIDTLQDFAKTIHIILRSDRDVLMGVGGFTGEGKTTFVAKLQKEYAKISGTKWSFNNMTWDRKELLKWIDGEKGSKKDFNGLRKGQKPEYSALMPDELFAMFFKRNWYDEEQISAIATFNMYRDRHLFIGGNIPDFWDLDSSFLKRVRFYVYIPERGLAWVFQQENNPFSADPWNVSVNKKMFRKYKNPYRLNNFVCEIKFSDFTPWEKEKYLDIRNEKRLTAFDNVKKEKIERYSTIKLQRDNMIRILLNSSKKHKFKLTYKDLAEVLGISKEAIRLIYEGLR